jgi:site-specific recombinase XerD
LAYLAGLAPGSRRTQGRALETLAELATGGRATANTLPWQALTPAHTAALRERLAERYAPATANRHLAALRGVLREAWRLGLMDAEAYHRARDVKDVRGSRLPAGRSLTAGEVRALFEACARDPNTAAGSRDAAILALLYGCGLRRAEAVYLELADLEHETGTLRVRGKGNRERVAHLVNGARRAVDAWLARRGDAPGALLCPVSKAGCVTVRALTSQAVLLALRTRGQEANVSGFSPHDCRRSFVGDLLDAGADIATVQRLAGHASPATTSRYDRRPEAVKRRAVELLHVPFAG